MVRYRLSTLVDIGLTLAVLLVLSCARESGLRFSLESPVVGSKITVTYPPLGALADESELALRATYRTSGDEVRLFTIPNMRRRSGNTFSARFTLPEVAVYAAFVVEDTTGQRLDTNRGKLFDLLVHDPDGTPLYHALKRQTDEFEDRNSHTVLEALRRAIGLYPDSLGGWSDLRYLEVSALGSSNGDSLFVWHQENLAGIHERYKDREDLPPATIQAISNYAAAVRHSEGAVYWDAVAEEAIGTDHWAVEIGYQIMDQWLNDRDADAALGEFERYWPDAQETISMFGAHALKVAIEAKDLATVDRWVERNFDQITGFVLPQQLTVLPERRERAVEIARDKFEETNPLRPLGRTVNEHAQSLAPERADLLADYVWFLAEYASADEAIGIVEEAAAQSASPDLFEALGQLKLGEGDIEGAARAYALVASDPGTSRSQADSLALLVGHVARSCPSAGFAAHPVRCRAVDARGQPCDRRERKAPPIS